MQFELKDFCAEGCAIQRKLLPVSPESTLQVITFTPPQTTELPPILFIPGWISLMTSWQSVLQTMTRNFTVHYLETREKTSAYLTGNPRFDVDSFGQDIANTIDQLSLPAKEYLIFASSLGATAVIDGFFKIHQPPLAAILIGPNAVFRIPPFWLNVVRLFPPRLYLGIKPVIKWYLHNFRLNPDKDALQYAKYCHNLDHADPWRLKKAALSFARYQIWDKLATVTCPTLIVGASHDALHDNSNLRKMAQLMPCARYIDLETNSRSHSPIIMDYIYAFLDELRGKDQSPPLR